MSIPKYNWQEIEAWHAENGMNMSATARHFCMPYFTVYEHFKHKPSPEIIKEYVDAIPTGALSFYHGLYVTHEPYSPKLHAFPLRIMTVDRFVTWLHQFPACQDLHEMQPALAGRILSSLELRLKTPEITDALHSHIHVIR